MDMYYFRQMNPYSLSVRRLRRFEVRIGRFFERYECLGVSLMLMVVCGFIVTAWQGVLCGALAGVLAFLVFHEFVHPLASDDEP